MTSDFCQNFKILFLRSFQVGSIIWTWVQCSVIVEIWGFEMELDLNKLLWKKVSIVQYIEQSGKEDYIVHYSALYT